MNITDIDDKVTDFNSLVVNDGSIWFDYDTIFI